MLKYFNPMNLLSKIKATLLDLYIKGFGTYPKFELECVPMNSLFNYMEHRQLIKDMLNSYNVSFLRSISNSDTFIRLPINAYWTVTCSVRYDAQDNFWLTLNYPDGSSVDLFCMHNDYIITELYLAHI